ncbi:DUF1643 domain-containing protein [Staphylococcus saprophyticus]|uniref:DUF1643 domain-containing protein n=1 Tax=Staphylococcus saprophyticus TaxID=29385 RepID=UPI0028A1B926|nr:DUF1643 domain-containing protein [Staphylococcus saprophyticus]
MQNIQCTLETEAIFSDDNQHRYLLKKTWDNDKKIISVITCYPNFEGTKKLDLTTQLIMNKVVEMDEFGSIHFVNLYSNITTPINIKHLENSHDKHTDIQIMKAVKESDKVLLAWGSFAKKPLVRTRVNEVLDMLKPHKNKISTLTNPQTNEIMHPLNPYARKTWTIK